MEESTTPVQETPAASVSGPTNKPPIRIIALIGIVLLAALGLLYYFFMYKSQPDTGTVAFDSYECTDGSFYTVLTMDGKIGVSGKIYDLVASEDGMRYEGPWALAFTVRDTVLEVSLKDSGEHVATCTLGEYKGTPSLGV